MEDRVKNKVFGNKVDDEGRCLHFYQNNDIACLKCQKCQKYYSCYQCHNEMNTHKFVPMKKSRATILCGHCRTVLTFSEYTKGLCSQCGSHFNPKCYNHYDIYFR